MNLSQVQVLLFYGIRKVNISQVKISQIHIQDLGDFVLRKRKKYVKDDFVCHQIQ